MVTIAEGPEDPRITKEDIAERVDAIRNEAQRGAAYILTGDSSGRVRRNLLYVVAAALIVVGLPLLALIPLLLLALTDAVVLP